MDVDDAPDTTEEEASTIVSRAVAAVVVIVVVVVGVTTLVARGDVVTFISTVNVTAAVRSKDRY